MGETNVLLNAASSFRAATVSLGLGLSGCGSSCTPTPKFTDDGLADCPPALATPEANQCAGVFRQYRLQCTDRTLPVSNSAEPYLRFFDCLWKDKNDLDSGLLLIETHFDEAFQKTIFGEYPELELRRSLSEGEVPSNEDIPASSNAFVYEGWRYVKKSDSDRAIRWNLKVEDSLNSMETWDAKSQQWVKGSECMTSPIDKRLSFPKPLPDPLPEQRPDPVSVFQPYPAPIADEEPVKKSPSPIDSIIPCETNIGAGEAYKIKRKEVVPPDIKTIDLGSSKGSFVVDYEMYSVEDGIELFYEGSKLWESGCVSGSGVSKSITINGRSTEITVRVNQFCRKHLLMNPKTAWVYKVSCPK